MAPVFHTKTIESILKPVAEQVSQLVIIHEEGESGIAIPDLSSQITAVTAAVVNLVDVAKQTCASSKDAILKEEMPVAYTKVEVSSTNLAESTQTLKKDPYSVDGRRMLLDGARGILSGTSSLLLTFDDAEVRKILAACRQVMDYLYVAEVVEGMADLVTFVKNLTPGITNMAKQVEGRIKDLTHATHRDLLTQHMTGLKEKVQNLIPALKNFVQCHTSGASADEARENRNFLITKMVDHIIEIMRVLQLKVDDEYDLEDPTNMMRKARHALNEKIQAGKDWLDNPDAGPNGLGERALRDIIKQARLIGTMANDKGILDLCDRLESQIDKLADLRGKGLGSSPEALALAKEISNGLNKLQEMVDDAIRREASSGARLPATTTDDQFDQALEWIDGSDDPNGIGRRAIDAMVKEGEKMAEKLPEPDRSELRVTCNNVKSNVKHLADLKGSGKGNTPQAHGIAADLKKDLNKLKVALQLGATVRVVDDFIDAKQPIKQLEKAARAPADVPNRQADYEDKAAAFEHHAHRLIVAAENTAVHGKHTNRQLAESIRSAAKDMAELSPQVSHAGKILLMNPDPNSPGHNAAAANFEKMRDAWVDKCDELTGFVDAATDACDFIAESEAAMKRDYDTVNQELAHADPNLGVVVAKGGDMVRRANRVTQVANAEAENTEDADLKRDVSGAVHQLASAIPPHVQSTKQIAMNPRNREVKLVFDAKSGDLISAVGAVRQVLEPPPPPPPEPTPPPSPPPEKVMEEVLVIKEAPMAAAELPSTIEIPPPRPPAPKIQGIDSEESAELQKLLESTQVNQQMNPMAVAAQQLHKEATKWSDEGNDIIRAARRMAMLFAKMSKFISDPDYFEKHSKKELIDTAKMITLAGQDLVREARKVADKCPDRRMKNELLGTIDRIPTVSTQLKILATVKATMFGAKDLQADLDATEMLVGCAENLMTGAKQVVKDCEAASIKIRAEHGQIMKWKREPGNFGCYYAS